MRKRVFLFVIDGLGVGASEDAHLFNDQNSNTFLNTYNTKKMNIPTLSKLGIKNIDGLNLDKESQCLGCYAKIREQSAGKDTTTGHFEMMGIISKQPMPTFPNGFPKEVVDNLQQIFGTKILGNCVASGTKIISELGDEHIKTGYPIIYTSADSVLQVACHVDVMPLEKLYNYCEKIREKMTGNYSVGRVIARPFCGTSQNYQRLNNERKDFSVIPNQNNTMKHLFDAKKSVIAVGKISDIFAHQSITDDYPSHNNTEALASTQQIQNKDFEGLVFINLVDTDMLYGHRNDAIGYANCLENIDKFLANFVINLKQNDLLIVTGDHGNDPTTTSSDHSREFVPLLVYGTNVMQNKNLGTLNGFNNIGELIEDFLLNKKSKIGEHIWKN